MVTAIIVVFRVVPAGPDEQAPRVPFDYTGAGLLGLGLGVLLLGVSEGPNWGWSSPLDHRRLHRRGGRPDGVGQG